MVGPMLLFYLCVRNLTVCVFSAIKIPVCGSQFVGKKMKMAEFYSRFTRHTVLPNVS